MPLDHFLVGLGGFLDVGVVAAKEAEVPEVGGGLGGCGGDEGGGGCSGRF